MKFPILIYLRRFLTPAFFTMFLFPSVVFSQKKYTVEYISAGKDSSSQIQQFNFKTPHSFVLHKPTPGMGYAADLMIFNGELFATLIKRVQEFNSIILLSDVRVTAGYFIVTKNPIMG